MTIKILAFGESDLVSRFGQKSRGGHSLQSDDTISVDNITIGEISYLLFAVKQRNLVGEQATGTNGLLFFLSGQTPLFEQKKYLTELLNSRAEFEGVPLAIIFQKGRQLSLKDVVNYMELYRLKDRASMIKQVNWSEKQWIDEVYGWVKAQSQQTKSKSFQAVPKVVKIKPKYRESVEQQSQKKYQDILGEKDIRGIVVKKQQQVYIDREKEKLKQQNMQNQLSNFNKNKRKMAPYDIKPAPNPKIQPNLHFFLKDPNAQPPPEISIKIQTDDFKQRNPPPPYKPKKTGINTATQIEQNQLFNFDKQVRPILAILTTKALQSAALQIEEQEEFLKMAKYKTAYEERVKRQKQHEQKNIDEQLRVMKQKDKLLENHRNRSQVIRNIQYRTQCYQIANNFLSNIYQESTNKIIKAKTYADNLTNFLQSEYIDQIMSKTSTFYKKLVQEQSSIKGLFEKDVISSITDVVKGPKAIREVIKKRIQDRLTNKNSTFRRIHILYKHEAAQISNFSKYLAKYFDSSFEDFVRNREEQIQQIADKVQSDEGSEEQLHKAKNKDSAEFISSGHQSFLINNQKQICFTWTPNRYEKSNQSGFTTGLMFIDKEGEMVEDLVFGKIDQKFKSFLRSETGLRYARQNVNMDEGIVINLAKVPQNIKGIVVLNRFNQAQRFKNQAQAKKIKYATYGVQFWERKISIHQKNIGQSIKWQQAIKSQEGEEIPSQSVITVGYLLRRRVLQQWWNLEDIAYTYQPIKSEEDLNHFLEEISRWYYRSGDILKQEQDEQRIERPISNQDKKSNARIKSKKVIEEPKKRTVLKVTTKILSQVQVNLSQTFESTIKKFAGNIEEWKQFLQICQNGWELWMKGKKLTSIQQLAAFKKIGDLILKRVPKPQQPKVQKVAEGEGNNEDADAS